MIAIAQANTDAAAGKYGLVFNQTESFWLVPFLGGFGGSVFAEDGVTPTLDTDAMVGALTFLHDLKYANGVMPAEADYNVADGLFNHGDAAMIVNGDWTLGAYVETFGESLGLGPIPEIVGHDLAGAVHGRQVPHGVGRRRGRRGEGRRRGRLHRVGLQQGEPARDGRGAVAACPATPRPSRIRW